MTQEELARAAEISLRKVARSERNEVELRFSTIGKLTVALRIEPCRPLDSQ